MYVTVVTMIARLLVLASGLLIPAPAQEAPRLQVEPVATFGSSRMRALTCTPDGYWIYEAEGAVVRVLDTWDEVRGEHSLDGFSGAKSFQVGRLGVLPSALCLDPDAGAPPVGGPADLLYVAAGRDGLWVAQADTRPGLPNLAWRVDDSGSGVPGDQDGRRWCVAVDTVEVGGERYLAALFARKDASRLRLYPLDLVRALANPLHAEVGHELAPSLQVGLGAHPQAPTAGAGPSFGRSLALGMAVDSTTNGAGAPIADVYIALGHHGLARVELRPTSTGVTGSATYGPVFGSGSAYELDQAHDLIPAHLDPALYGSLVYETARPYLDAPRVDRVELPQVTSVAVLRADVDGRPSLHLVATVDHLFWLAFDLAAQPFAPDTPILHHAGDPFEFVPKHATHTLRGMRPEGETGKRAGAGRAVRTIVHPTRGPLVVVATWDTLLAKDYLSFLSEGIAYNGDLEWGGGGARIDCVPSGTYVYGVGHDATTGYTFAPIARVTTGGGPSLALPDGPIGQDLPDHLRVVHHYRQGGEPGPPGKHVVTDLAPPVGGVALDLVRLVGPGDTWRLARPARSVRGANAFHAAFDRVRPNLIVIGQNDSAVQPPGLFELVEAPGEPARLLARRRTPAGGGPNDVRLRLGLLGDPDSQLVAGHAPHRRSYVSSGPAAKEGQGERWRITRLAVPAGPGGIRDAVREAWWTLAPPDDTFGSPGRRYYTSATVEPTLDADLAQQGSADRLLFGTRQSSPEGLVLVDRDGAFDWAATHGEEGRDYALDELSSAGVWHQPLVTHPEFSWMPRADPILRAWWRADFGALPAALHGDHRDIVMSWTPEVFRANDPDDPQQTRWVLAAPCGAIQGDPEWNVFDLDPGFEPRGIYRDWHGHGLVQFWELWDDPADVPDRGLVARTWTHPGYDDTPGTADDVAGCSPLARLILPLGPSAGAPKGNVYRLRKLEVEVDGVRRVYLFGVDFAGRLSVHAVEDILAQADPTARLDDASHLIEVWTTPESLADDLPSALHDVLIDPGENGRALVFAAVRRVGVVVLAFDPGAPPGERLQELGLIQTGDVAASLDLGTGPGGERRLLVSDAAGGLRIFDVGR